MASYTMQHLGFEVPQENWHSVIADFELALPETKTASPLKMHTLGRVLKQHFWENETQPLHERVIL